ncbi:hypothetical protein AC579_5871 [Pseudocercospora musae]|uniref:Uncharacterized protein n=1 Tax=Pseudocercospora musae TaxID=113226 RepID=A0A139HXE4_9PEZI|nr:hypothetical protein AC579_5871 [Pseudocercospora musae]
MICSPGHPFAIRSREILRHVQSSTRCPKQHANPSIVRTLPHLRIMAPQQESEKTGDGDGDGDGDHKDVTNDDLFSHMGSHFKDSRDWKHDYPKEVKLPEK